MGRRYGEPWFECHICGFEFPMSHGVRHYDTKRLVDKRCADEPGHSDYMERLRKDREDDRFSPQPVSNQGEDV